MESAITSRDTSEYFMPSVPIDIPSDMVMVPNICGMAPAVLNAASARVAKAPIPMLQGVMVLCAFATPTMGLSKSLSPKPTARSRARLGERCTPCVTILLLRFSDMIYPLIVSAVVQRAGAEYVAGGILQESSGLIHSATCHVIVSPARSGTPFSLPKRTSLGTTQLRFSRVRVSRLRGRW